MDQELEREVARLGRIIRRLQEVVDSLARERHIREEHQQPYPSGTRDAECRDTLCQEAFSATRED